MLNAFLVALIVFICVGGAELVDLPWNRPIVIATGRSVLEIFTQSYHRSFIEAVTMGVKILAELLAEPGIATVGIGTAFAIMLGKGSEVARQFCTSNRYPWSS